MIQSEVVNRIVQWDTFGKFVNENMFLKFITWELQRKAIGERTTETFKGHNFISAFSSMLLRQLPVDG